MTSRAIQTDGAPAAIGPYSQAIEVRGGQLVFISGQIALDPDTGEIVEGDVAAQTDRIMNNLAAVLVAGGLDWTDVVKTTIYLTDMSDFGAVNEVYAHYVSSPPPARATVQVSGLPKGVAVEIDAVAVRPG